jgi:hypothetical protein
MSKGAVFVATSHNQKTRKDTVSEVLRSVKLLLRHTPGLDVTLVASPTIIKTSKNQLKPFFQRIIQSKYPEFDGHMGAKIQALELSPYDKTLILDNDTLPIQNLSKGFDFIGEHHDIALSIAPNQELKDGSGITNFQNGVMFVHKNERNIELFKKWTNEVRLKDAKGPTRFIFSKLLLNSDVRIYALSYLWNFRIDLLLDFDLSDRAMKKNLSRVRVLHTHLKRKKALQIFHRHPEAKKILINIGDRDG